MKPLFSVENGTPQQEPQALGARRSRTIARPLVPSGTAYPSSRTSASPARHRLHRCIDSRKCILTFEVTCWLVLALGIFTELPIRQVFKYARRLRADEQTPSRAALCAARQRLG